MNLIKKLIRRSVVLEGISDDSEKADYPIQKVGYLGKVSNCEMIYPYGMNANMSNDCLPILFSISGNSENKVGIGGSPQDRIRDLEQNEVVFYHPKTKSKIYFKNNGDIQIKSEGGANVDVETTGDVKIAAANLNITGNVNIVGNLDTVGNVSSTGTLFNNTKAVGSTHTHSAGGAGPPN